jgi:tyrosinase
MGENETAGFDPIFYFHHCFIDRVFWKWQELHGATRKLDIDASDPGANLTTDPNGPLPAAE